MVGARMKISIGYDVSILETGRLTGVERVAQHLFPQLWAAKPDWEHLAFCRSMPKALEGAREVRHVEVPGRRLWRYTALPRAIRREKLDVFVSPVVALPLPCAALKVIYAHECQWRHRSGERGGLKHRLNFWLSALRADLVLTNSEFTAADIRAELGGLLKTPLKVIPLAGSPLTGKERQPDIKGLLAQLGIPERPYFLFVSTIRAKKNIDLMLDAFAKPELKDVGLILAGRIDDPRFVEKAKAQGLGNVHFTGYLPDGALNALHAHAQAFLYVSKNEGFGLPILEAFNSGTPLIASRMGSIPEVAGDAALYLDNLSAEELAGKCLLLLGDPRLVEQLRERGKRRAALYSWAHSAARLGDALDELLRQRGIC